MSGLETLGIVGNIFQVISFARETITLCTAVYDGCSPDDSLGENAASLATLSAQLQQYYQGKREKSLQTYQKTLETHLLADVCKQSDAIELTQREAFKELGDHLQHFVSQYAAGHTPLSELVKAESLSTKDHTTKEILRTEQAAQSYITTKLARTESSITRQMNESLEDATQKITSGMRQLASDAVTQAQREQFLTSLKFGAMNERWNQIVDSHEGTFEWILREHTAGDDSDASDDTSSYDESEWETTSNEDSSDHVNMPTEARTTNEIVAEQLPQNRRFNHR
ncbi:hypothetical protein F5B22DRAFT_659909 [Xylaria bambusicola]|uniref:uncharacterized protein n=1 Tax=Xylaria bambusicola TaxID=326684 RepID=UPI002008565D|nr:uncharacterized protein F5B22DRAFT_659909 [Xylaria bambusicola]KAI0506837.1 hypothetical protein F5B22DRAFT_659909 [Xylaria bambusicola]